MKKLLKYFICASIVLLPPLSSLRSQITHHSQGRLDENATAALDKAARKMKNVTFTVKLTMLDSQKKKKGEYTAQVKFQNPKYHLVAGDQEIVSDGTTVWQWNKSAKEIVVNNMPPENEIDLFNPSRLMTDYQKNFRAKYIRTDDNGDAVIDMQPKSAQSYHKIRLFINEETGVLNRIEVHKYDSSRDIYELRKQKFGRLHPPIKFNPADHPEAEVIDMR